MIGNKELHLLSQNQIMTVIHLSFLEQLPNEILLHIIRHLNISDLLNCAQTSKRIRGICQDYSLWRKINLHRKKVSAEFLEFIRSSLYPITNFEFPKKIL